MFVNIEKAEATVESDRLRIIGEVRDTVGIDRLNSIIRDQCRWPVVLASFLLRWQIQLRDLVVCPHRCVRFLRLLWGTRHDSSFYEREAWCVIIRADAVRPGKCFRRCCLQSFFDPPSWLQKDIQPSKFHFGLLRLWDWLLAKLWVFLSTSILCHLAPSSFSIVRQC